MEKDIIKKAPDKFKLLIENDQVQVIDWQLLPGQRSPMHSHVDHVIHFLTDCKLRFYFPEGSSTDVEAKAGEVRFVEAMSHEVENLGDAPVRGIAVEVKEKVPMRKAA